MIREYFHRALPSKAMYKFTPSFGNFFPLLPYFSFSYEKLPLWFER